MTRSVVADASALLPTLIPAERWEREADLLVELHASGAIELCAPPLLEYELLNALYIATRGKAGQPPLPRKP
jgi:predicted nucleic acid-binding protein